MAQENAGPQAKAPWTKIFSGFMIALDLKKLLLAAAGILLTSLGWWVLSCIFYTSAAPKWKNFPPNDKAAWEQFKPRRDSWNLLHELAGSSSAHLEDAADMEDATDRAKTWEEFQAFENNPPREAKKKPSGRLCTWPWLENRGPNPYLMVADRIKQGAVTPKDQTSLLHWLIDDEAPVVLEPIFKFLMPVYFFFDQRAGIWVRTYLILIILWTVAVWGFFGGAICRIAAVQVARNERITLKEAILFAKERYASFFIAPVFPMIVIGILTLLLVIFGLIEWIPYLGDLFAGLLWPIVLLFGFIMAIILVGLVGWPLMNATISTEGSDSFDALSRSYSYVYQAPWQYLWYNLLAVLYGAVLVFFIGFMASLLVFLGKWGVSNAPWLASSDPQYDRDPSYLFYYAPTSFGWRDLLIKDSHFVVPSKEAPHHLEFTQEYIDKISFFNRLGAGLVSIWVGLLFLLVIGFGYSYFWSASTIIYFLMRHHVDDTDMDDVHLEDEALDDPFLKGPTPAAPTPPAPEAKPGTISLNIVEASAAPPPAAPPPPPPQAPG